MRPRPAPPPRDATDDGGGTGSARKAASAPNWYGDMDDDAEMDALAQAVDAAEVRAAAGGAAPPLPTSKVGAQASAKRRDMHDDIDMEALARGRRCGRGQRRLRGSRLMGKTERAIDVRGL